MTIAQTEERDKCDRLLYSIILDSNRIIAIRNALSYVTDQHYDGNYYWLDNDEMLIFEEFEDLCAEAMNE